MRPTKAFCQFTCNGQHMCGFMSLVNLSSREPIDAWRFDVALTTLRHRGPDAINSLSLGDRIRLGHTRLSIIDLEPRSGQPFSILNRYWIVFNGEIFNYLELRKELEGLGAHFVTEGDTEVLLYSYAIWGEACVERFNGMWAFVIYDQMTHTVFCSRDRYGEKPFNYVLDEGMFIASSEIKAILAYKPSLAIPNYNMIGNFCRTSVGAQQIESWFKNVVRLPPGHNLIIRNGGMMLRRYWRYPTTTNRAISFHDARAEYASIFEDAVKVRMRSDVPLGLALSSGLDSSSIAYMMKRLDPASHHSFTACFRMEDTLETDHAFRAREAIDESTIASKVAAANNFQAHLVQTDYSDVIPSLSRILYHLESGNSSPAIIPLMQLHARASKDVTVLLEGQGADELLGGYITSVALPAVKELVSAGRFGEASDFLSEYSKTYKPTYALKLALRDSSNKFDIVSRLHQSWTGIARAFGPNLRDYIRLKDYPDLPHEGASGSLAQLLMRQHSGGLVNLLHYGDALSMAHGIETRNPFLDYRLVEFVFSLPSDFKVKGGIGKYLHREAMRGIVPDYILDERAKFGFSTPIGAQFKKKYADGQGPIDLLFSERCLDRGLFDREGLAALLADHQSEHRDYGPLLFRLLSVELWFRLFVDQDVASHEAAMTMTPNAVDSRRSE